MIVKAKVTTWNPATWWGEAQYGQDNEVMDFHGTCVEGFVSGYNFTVGQGIELVINIDGRLQSVRVK